MRILHTVAPARIGGLEEVVMRLAVGLRDRGHDLVVATVLGSDDAQGGHPFEGDLRAAGVRVEPIVVPGRAYRSEVSALERLCGEFRPDILHTHGYRPDVVHPFAARGLRIPLVSTLHGFTGGGWRNRFYEWLQIRSIASFDAVVAVSGAMAGHLRGRGVPRRRLHIVPNAWSPRNELLAAAEARDRLGVPADTFHVGWIGRLSEEKAPDVLLAAVPGIARAVPGLVVSFIGDGPLRPALERRSANMDADVRFHGEVTHAARLLAGFDTIVLSSRTEGTPIVLFEAMQAAVPLVATRVGGVPDVLEPGTAHLVASGASDDLAEAVLDIHRRPEEAGGRVERALEVLESRYALDPWIERYEGIYSSVRRPGGGAGSA